MWDGVRDTNIWVISNKTLNKLSDEDAKLVQDCASDALEWGNEYLAENESDIVEQLKKQGVELMNSLMMKKKHLKKHVQVSMMNMQM